MSKKTVLPKKKKSLLAFLVFFLILAIVILTSGCVEKDLINDPTTGEIKLPENLSSLLDGKYTASTDFYDDRGYAQQLDLSLKKGIITQINFKEVSKNTQERLTLEGETKTWDGLETNTLGSLYFRLYNELLLTQNPDQIQTITGATQTTERFIALAKAGINQATGGNHDPVKIETSNTYTIRSQIDPEGYQGVLTATFKGATLITLAYDEFGIEDGKSKSKLIDSESQQTYKSIFGAFTQETLNSQNLNPIFPEGELTSEKIKYIETLKLLKDAHAKY